MVMKTLHIFLFLINFYSFYLVFIRDTNLIKRIWWKLFFGKKIIVVWPVGHVEVGPNSRSWNGCIGDLRQIVYSSDPNEHYRPWLEANVGRQGWDWDWSLDFSLDNTLIIKFRKGKEEWATQASLMWNN